MPCPKKKSFKGGSERPRSWFFAPGSSLPSETPDHGQSTTDITGKLHGVPVYRLMGGPTRDRIRVYLTPNAYKVAAGGPKTFSGSPKDIESLANGIKEARERAGKDGTVMFDARK